MSDILMEENICYKLIKSAESWSEFSFLNQCGFFCLCVVFNIDQSKGQYNCGKIILISVCFHWNEK